VVVHGLSRVQRRPPSVFAAFTSTPSSAATLADSSAKASRCALGTGTHATPPPIPIAASAPWSLLCGGYCVRHVVGFQDHVGVGAMLHQHTHDFRLVEAGASQKGVAPIKAGEKYQSCEERRIGVHVFSGAFASAPCSSRALTVFSSRRMIATSQGRKASVGFIGVRALS